jgi:polyhydroxybutyrate depolymerase
MTVAGLDRDWVLHVPPAHDGRTPLPLIVQLHGYGNDVTDMAFTGLDALGDEEGFVVVSPVGRGSKPRWLFELDTPALDVTTANPDIEFIGALIDRLEHDLCLDSSRIYVAGLSNGAWMTSALACALGDRIAAVAPVAGVMDFGDACHSPRPVPVIAFHGTKDSTLPMAGGFGRTELAELKSDTGGTFGDNPVWAIPVRDRVQGIAARNGCQPEPTSTHVSTDAELLAWPCPPDSDVELVIVEGGGHDWPRAEPSASSESPAPDASAQKVDATRLIWDFFKAHPLPAR